MFEFWWRPLAFLSTFTALSLMLWATLGAVTALSFAGAALLGYTFLQLNNLAQLYRWLQNPKSTPLPSAAGAWDDVFYGLQRLMRREKSSQVELSAALDRFQHAAMALPDGIVMLKETDQIEWCNPMAGQHFGLDVEHDRGQFMKYLIRQTQFTAYLDGQNYSEPLVMRSPVNRNLTLSIQLIPFGNAQKLLMSRDVTQLERVDAVRRDFVANVSHELRTPLTVVGGFLETFADLEMIDTKLAKPYIHIMLDHTQRMQRLIEDLLTLSRLESAENVPREERVNVLRLMQGLEGDARSLSAGRHEITLAMNCEDWLLGSEDELRSAFGNLVSNAVRYTPPGGKITLRWDKKGTEGWFCVEDSGEGIEPQHIPRLTERFYRVDQSRSRETGGTGLGLAIVKHVLTRHQARLNIQSEIGKGSCFSAVFPASRLIKPESMQERPAATALEAT